VPASEAQEDGTYPDGTVHQLVEARLAEMAKTAREFGRPRNDISDDKSSDKEPEKSDD